MTLLLLSFLVIAILIHCFVKQKYVKEKALWWIFIIAFFLLFSVWTENYIALEKNYLLYIWIAILVSLASFEFFRNLTRKWFKNYERIIFWFLFLILLAWFSYFIYTNPIKFLTIFIVISFSDIVAYFVWKYLTWKKWFTKLSPNKALSGVLAQIIFIIVVAYFLNLWNIWEILLLGILAPIWDLTESYFKRKTGEKDMAYYIPGHWWVLDRIDSSFLSLGVLGLISIFKCCIL